MNEDREYVEARWEEVVFTVWNQDGPLNLQLGGVPVLSKAAQSSEECYAAARKFTEAREEEIRLVREEIELLEYEILTANDGSDPDFHDLADEINARVAIVKRILAARQSALDALLKGWRQQ
jgi:hypothetical protein